MLSCFKNGRRLPDTNPPVRPAKTPSFLDSYDGMWMICIWSVERYIPGLHVRLHLEAILDRNLSEWLSPVPFSSLLVECSESE